MKPPLTDHQALAAARAAGFTPPTLVTIVAIAHAESALVPDARNINDDLERSVDRGILQINSHWHPEVSDGCADAPRCAFRAAWTISSQGTDFSPWSTFQTGAYLPFVEQVTRHLADPKDPAVVPGPVDPHTGRWHLELKPWPFAWSQLHDPPADGRIDENAGLNCGAESVAEAIMYLDNVELPADYVHDIVRGEGYQGYLTFADLQLALHHIAHADSKIHVASSRAGWLYLIWKALKDGHPSIGLFSFSAPGSDDGHLRPIVGMDPHHVISSDPFTGKRRVETYTTAWSWSKGSILEVLRTRDPNLTLIGPIPPIPHR